MKRFVISWKRVETEIVRLARDYSMHHLDFVLGVSRGGIIPGVLLARELHCEYRTVEPVADKWKEFENCTVLIVDDILDSGTTLKFIESKIKEAQNLRSFIEPLFTKSEEEKRNDV